MIDRLSEIKARPAVIRTVVDVEWLIAEVERLKAIIEEHRLMYCKDVGNLQAEVERLKKIAVGGYTVSKLQVEIERLKEAFRRLSYTSEQRGITIEKLKAEVEKLEDAWT